MNREQTVIFVGFAACVVAAYLLYKLQRMEATTKAVLEAVIMQVDGKGKFFRDTDGVIRWKEGAR